MSKLYKLTQKTPKLVKKLAKQENIKIKLKSNKCLYYDKQNGFREDNFKVLEESPQWFIDKAIPKIETPQILQILKAFEEVLGENPDYDYDVDFWGFSDDEKHFYSIDRLHNLAYEKGFENGWRFRKPKTLSQALWEKYNSFTWSSKAPLTVGGLYRGEEGLIAVLEDLNLILKSKIK